MVINKDKEDLLTQELLKEKLHYDKDTGIFTWTDSKLNAHKMRNKEAGTINSTGYRHIKITLDGKLRVFCAHRLVWLYEYGEFPKLQLDHINHNRLDNRINNLREVTSRENQRNRAMNKNNKSGYTGVTFNKAARKYRVFVSGDNRKIHLGYFEKLEDAALAAKEGREHYGFHKNHGASE
jgi:hypothetical protein